MRYYLFASDFDFMPLYNKLLIIISLLYFRYATPRLNIIFLLLLNKYKNSNINFSDQKFLNTISPSTIRNTSDAENVLGGFILFSFSKSYII